MDQRIGQVSPSANFENSLRKKTPPSSRTQLPKSQNDLQIGNVVEKLHETEVLFHVCSLSLSNSMAQCGCRIRSIL